jgi:hypothetical protein
MAVTVRDRDSHPFEDSLDLVPTLMAVSNVGTPPLLPCSIILPEDVVRSRWLPLVNWTWEKSHSAFCGPERRDDRAGPAAAIGGVTVASRSVISSSSTNISPLATSRQFWGPGI